MIVYKWSSDTDILKTIPPFFLIKYIRLSQEFLIRAENINKDHTSSFADRFTENILLTNRPME